VNVPKKSVPAEIDHGLSQLNQFLGQQKYAPADAVLRQFVSSGPNFLAPKARAAAAWALGLIHEGKNVPALATLLEERLNGQKSIPPEDRRVRRMAAVTLGRMKAKEALPSLRKHCPQRKPSEDPVNNACGWAIERITGEAMPAPETVRRVERDWFLRPIP
jgi:hypothetical protein